MSVPVREHEAVDDQLQTFPRLADSGVSVRGPEVTFPYLIAPHLLAQRLLGEGGTAVVYEALHTRLKVRVAVKMLKLSGAEAASARERMQREAELCARIDNPRIPRIYDVDTLPDGTPYVVMEEVHGRPLDELLDKGPLDVDLACAIICEVLEALGELHSAGIVHRDVKPSNLILEDNATESLRIRVLDLGIAKPLGPDLSSGGAARLTLSGTLLGTPHYMSNEQLLGGDVDERTDLYAAGVMLYEILAGKTPFNGDSVSQVLAAALRDEPVPLRQLRLDVPLRLEEIVTRAMQRELTARYQSAAAMLEDLRAFQTSEKAWPRDAPTLLVQPATNEANSGAIMPEPRPAEDARKAAPALHSLPPAAHPQRTKRTRIWGGVGLVAVCALAGLAWPSDLGEPPVGAPTSANLTLTQSPKPTAQPALTEPPHADVHQPLDVATTPLIIANPAPLQPRPPLLDAEPVDAAGSGTLEPALVPSLEPALVPSQERSGAARTQAKRRAKRGWSGPYVSPLPLTPMIDAVRTVAAPEPRAAIAQDAATSVEPTKRVPIETPAGLPLNPYLEHPVGTKPAPASETGLPSNPYPAPQ